MIVEVAAPATLPLGLVRGEGGTLLLGLTLQHPPVHLSVRAYSGFRVTGARADIGYEYARRFLEAHGLARRAEVEIELAIPAMIGLGSDAALAMGIARGLARWYGLPQQELETSALVRALGLGPENALEVWGYDQGGMLLVETEDTGVGFPCRVRRKEIAHDERSAWALVMWLPRISAYDPEIKSRCFSTLLSAAPDLSIATTRVVNEELWPAAENDEPEDFAQALVRIQEMNWDALAALGTTPPQAEMAETVVKIMRENGALACGQSATGPTVFALVKGATASVQLRKALRRDLGHQAGRLMATIIDNRGASHLDKE